MRSILRACVVAACVMGAGSAAASSLGVLEVRFDGLEMRPFVFGTGGVPTATGEPPTFPTGALVMTYNPFVDPIDGGISDGRFIYFEGVGPSSTFSDVSAEFTKGMGTVDMGTVEFRSSQAGIRFVSEVGGGGGGLGFIANEEFDPFSDLLISDALWVIFGKTATDAIFAADEGDILQINDVNVYFGFQEEDFFSTDGPSFAPLEANVNGVSVAILQAPGAAPAIIPLPATLPMMAAALGGLALMRRRRVSR